MPCPIFMYTWPSRAFSEIVVCNDIVWKYFERHLCEFIPVQGRLEIHILNVNVGHTKFYAGCADNTGST